MNQYHYFNSCMVRLRLHYHVVVGELTVDFNSCMVRLRPVDDRVARIADFEFQFLYGTIKTRAAHGWELYY